MIAAIRCTDLSLNRSVVSAFVLLFMDGFYIFTEGKVKFSEASVSHSVHGVAS